MAVNDVTGISGIFYLLMKIKKNKIQHLVLFGRGSEVHK